MDELQEFDRYLAHLSEGLGHADRHAGLRGYLPREWADGATRQGRCARGIAVCNQAADSAAANRALDGSGCAPALCAGRCRLRRGHGVSRAPERVGPALCGGRDRQRHGLAARARALAAASPQWSRASGQAAAPGRHRFAATPSAIDQGTRPGAWARALAHRHLARRNEHQAAFALCPRAGARSAPGQPARGIARTRVAAHRMAQG